MDQSTNKVIGNYDDAVAFIEEVSKPGNSQEQTTALYSKWAATYDSDLAHAEYKAPQRVAEELSAIMGDKKDSRILDCGAGTGQVGEKLMALGFTNIDALDASNEMLEVARSLGVYQNLICDFMGPNTLEIPSSTYDSLLAVGCFLDGHAKPDCLNELYRITKSGGSILISVGSRLLTTQESLKGDKLDLTIRCHEEEGLCKLRTRKVIPKLQYEQDFVLYHIHVC